MKIQKIRNFYLNSNANRNYLVELLAFIPFIAMIASGILMLIYHISENEKLLLFGINKSSWLLFHKITSCIALSMVIWHLIQHAYWIKNLITLQLKSKFKRINTTLFIVFTLAVLTAMCSWLVFSETTISDGLRGIHSKLGFLTIILFFFHIKNYFSWLKKMSLKFINFK
jgi:hypothetical protein